MAKVTDHPVIRPNEAGLDLLHEIALDMRTMRESVADVRERVAAAEGLNVNERIASITAKQASLQLEVTAIALKLSNMETAARPFANMLSELAKQLITAAVAVGGTLVAIAFKGH